MTKNVALVTFMTEQEIYTQEGLTAILLDNEAVSLYCEGIHRITMTLAEWHNINMALEGVNNEQV